MVVAARAARDAAVALGADPDLIATILARVEVLRRESMSVLRAVVAGSDNSLARIRMGHNPTRVQIELTGRHGTWVSLVVTSERGFGPSLALILGLGAGADQVD